jgi:hypothetical protein
VHQDTVQEMSVDLLLEQEVHATEYKHALVDTVILQEIQMFVEIQNQMDLPVTTAMNVHLDTVKNYKLLHSLARARRHHKEATVTLQI